MVKGLLEKLIRRHIPYAPFFFIILILLSAIAAPRAVGLMSRINTELGKLLPDDYATVKTLNSIKSKFKKKGGGDLILIVSSPNSVANFKTVDSLAAYLKGLPEVGEVRYQKQGYSFYDRAKLLFMDLEDLIKIKDRLERRIQRQKLSGLYIDFGSDETDEPFDFKDLTEKYRADYIRNAKTPYLTNDTDTHFAIWVYPKSKDGSLGYYQKFFDAISSKISGFPLGKYEPATTIGYAGAIRTRLDEYRTLIRDLKIAGIISFFVILLILLIYFKNPVILLIIFIPLISGMLFSFAISSFFITQLNVVTSFLFAILFGLGVDIGIHMMARYKDARSHGVGQQEAISQMLMKAGRSSAVAVLTTCASFFILIINDFKGFSEFGWIAGIGLTVTLIVYLVFFPSLIVLAEKMKLLRFKKKDVNNQAKSIPDGRPFPYFRCVVWVGALLTLLGGASIPLLEFEWNYRILRIHIPEREEVKARLKEIIGRVNSPAAIEIGGEAEARRLSSEYRSRKETGGKNSTIHMFRSSYDLVPRDQEEKMGVLGAIDRLLADDALKLLDDDEKNLLNDFRASISKTRPIQPEDVPLEVRETFYGIGEYRKNEVAYVFPLPKMELDDGRNAIAFYNDVHEVKAEEKTYRAASDALILADVLQTMFRDSRKTIILSVLALAIMVFFDFRDWRKTALVLVTLSAGMLCMFGIMAVAGLKLNFYNMIVIPMMIGMGEDNSVHLMHRFDEDKSSVLKAVRTSGSAALLASLTTMMGYAGLVFAHHPGLASIGVLAIIGMGCCMLSSLVFLPALLQVFSSKKIPPP